MRVKKERYIVVLKDAVRDLPEWVKTAKKVLNKNWWGTCDPKGEEAYVSKSENFTKENTYKCYKTKTTVKPKGREARENDYARFQISKQNEGQRSYEYVYRLVASVYLNFDLEDRSKTVHHILPVAKGGSDRVDNLLVMTVEEHNKLHAEVKG